MLNLSNAVQCLSPRTPFASSMSLALSSLCFYSQKNKRTGEPLFLTDDFWLLKAKSNL